MNLPNPIKHVVDALAELPSIGPRQATRLAFFLVNRGKNAIGALGAVIEDLKKIKLCSRCFFVHQNEGTLCGICADIKRNAALFAIVEKETDLLSIENTKKFHGCYLVLGEIPKTGVLEEWQKLRLQNLEGIIEKECGGEADEIILAFNPTSFGDFNSSLIAKELAPFAKKITRLGRGLPTGGEIEFADDETLGSALEKRS